MESKPVILVLDSQSKCLEHLSIIESMRNISAEPIVIDSGFRFSLPERPYLEALNLEVPKLEIENTYLDNLPLKTRLRNESACRPYKRKERFYNPPLLKPTKQRAPFDNRR